MDRLDKYLTGGDLRSISEVKLLIPLIQSQVDFDELFEYLRSGDRLVIMRAVDAIEKITVDKPVLLTNHKKDILIFLQTAIDKEYKWHLALLVPRLELFPKELREVWGILSKWAKDKKESKIVRVNSIQSLYDLTNKYDFNKVEFELLSQQVKAENVHSIDSRLRKLQIK